MRPISIDFAPRSAKRAALSGGVVGWLALLTGVVLCVSVGLTLFGLVQKQSVQTAALQQARNRLQQRTAQKPAPKKTLIPESQENAVNAAVSQLNLPWRDMFDAIEAATPAAIALLALEPDAKKHMVKGQAEARNSNDMLSYIEQLKKQAFFTSVILTKHEINEQDSNKPMRFQFEAEWLEVRP